MSARHRSDSTDAVVAHVDWTRCDGHGACAELLPELFGTDEWGYPVSRDGSRDPEVPRSLLGEARRAERACPAMALRLGVVRRDGGTAGRRDGGGDSP